MSEVEEIKARIAKKEAERDELVEGMKEIFAEDFRDKFKMDIDNLEKSIKQDEELLKGIQDD